MENKISVEIAKDGNRVPLWNGYQLHSLYEPKKEGVSISEKFLRDITDFDKPLLVLGLGFAYHILPLIDKFQDIYIAESCLELIIEAKKIEDISLVFEKCHLIDDLSKTPKLSDCYFLFLRAEMRFQEKYFRDVQVELGVRNSEFGIMPPPPPPINVGGMSPPTSTEASSGTTGGVAERITNFISQIRVLVNSPIYGGSYTTSKYVLKGLESLGVCVRMCDHSAAEPLLHKYLNPALASREKGGNTILIDQLNMLLSETLWQDVKTFKPNIVLFIAQSPYDEKLIKDLKKAGIVTMYWFVEDYKRFPYWQKVCNDFDYFFMIQKGDFERELKKVCRKIWGWLPVAAEPFYHKPINLSDADKSFYGSDISFMGAAYPNRVKFFKHFNTINLKLWGTGWTESDLPRYNIPLNEQRISIEQSNKIYQATKVNINLHSSFEDGLDGNFTTAGMQLLRIEGDFVNPRTFEIAACGGFQLVDDREAVRELFVEDEEIVFFKSVEEAMDKANFYLKNEDLRKKIALAAKEKTLKYHTYSIRLEKMLKTILTHTPELATAIENERVKIQDFLTKINDKEFENFINSIHPAMRTSYSTIINKIKESQKPLKKYEAYAMLLDTFYTKQK